MINDENLTIAIVYNSESKVIRGVAQDLIALQSTSETANILHDSLISLGYPTDKIKINGNLNSLKRGLEKLSSEHTLVFNLCDGFKGENTAQACITRLINALSFPQTGSTEETIINCTDKSRAKEILIAADLRTPAYQVFSQPSGSIELSFPVIVKPLFEDGSIGINSDSVVQNTADTYKQIDYVIQKYEQPALVEEFIPGRELAVSLWGNKQIEVLPMVEHDFSLVADPLAHILTYQVKWIPDYYDDQKIIWRCPAELPDQMSQALADAAISAYKAIGLRDFARIDFRFYDEIPYILDINEIPDLHPEAGFAQSALAAGYSFDAMVQKILDITIVREDR